jgi:hypothetical protein
MRPTIDLNALRREAMAGERDDRVVVDRGWLREVLEALTGTKSAKRA